MNRILIAEDEPHIVRFLVKGLRAQGYATGEAGDGDLALAMARSGQFDLMLLDLGLPGRDGLPRRPAEAGPGRTGLAPSGPGQAGGPGQESRRSALVSLLSVLRSALCRSVCESRPAS